MSDARKEQLRTQMLAARDGIDPARRLELAGAIQERLYELPGFSGTGSVALYWASGSEVLVSELALRLSEQEQRRIFLPFVLNGELELTEWRPQDPVVTAEYGGMHPRYHRVVELDEVDFIVVPGIAFDRRGGRLGSGTGHYDRLLARLDPRTIQIGLCFGAQVVDEVPAATGDERLNYLVTEDAVVACA
jgi:5-formyltetrahydrofolate cyclo-ligase